jgi:hypothetical protein
MFDLIDRQTHPWRSYLAHALLAILAVPIVGLANYRLTPVIGAALALIVGRRLEGTSIGFTWIPALILFVAAQAELALGWDPSWAQVSRWQYVTNNVLGPNCGSTECIYTVPTAMLTGAIGYSGAGAVALRLSPRAS